MSKGRSKSDTVDLIQENTIIGNPVPFSNPTECNDHIKEYYAIIYMSHRAGEPEPGSQSRSRSEPGVFGSSEPEPLESRLKLEPEPELLGNKISQELEPKPLKN